MQRARLLPALRATSLTEGGKKSCLCTGAGRQAPALWSVRRLRAPPIPSVQIFLKYIVSKTRGKCKRILRGGAPLQRRTAIRRSFSCLPRICPFRSAPRTSDTAAFFAHGGAHRRPAAFLPFPAAFPAPRSLIFYTVSGRAPRVKRPSAA